MLPARLPDLRPCGDTALSVDFGDRLDPALTARVIALDAALRAAPPPGVVETVPSYRALMVHIDPLAVDIEALRATILALAARPVGDAQAGRNWRVPVVFGGAHGVDLDAVAARAGLSPAACIDAFAAATYTVAMVGFLPGFSYLSGLPPALATPRRADPRPRIPASSVAIGGAQAALGSIAGPSGWHLLGQSPVRPFLSGRDPVFLFAPGDRLRFDPLPADDWDRLDRAAAAGDPVAREVP
jgi:KipI family sensor histidine kinase inhibitor